MTKTVLSFGLLIAALLALFQLGKYKFFEGDITMEVVVSVAAILFFFIGLYFRKKQLTSKETGLEYGQIDHQKLKELNISDREQEVLQELANGLSNKEIADKLFVSESTVKTHVSNIYTKLKVQRRPQAILKSKEMKLVKNQ
ncbi:MAG: response regulator transcription factor [Crocinitomicaceae bacterium]|nr:response regulator transcription factor [Crocinitomicaceae bacterium]